MTMESTQGSFRIEGGAAGEPLRLIGVIDEHADLELLSQLARPASISLGGVRRINSFGVRSWMEALRQIPPSVRLRFIEVPSPLIDQINMVGGFLGLHEVASFYAPLACTKCGATRDDLLQVADCKKQGGRLPDAICAKCGAPMELDDVEEQYLLFLREGP